MKLEIGFRNQNKKGEWFEIISYTPNGYNLKFDNGVERKDTPRKKVLSGEVSSKKSPVDKITINVGDKFGKLTVIESDYPKDPVLLCDCGNKYTTVRYNLINNLRTSCGCSPMEHSAKRYWDSFNKIMENWNPSTHKLSVKKLPILSVGAGGILPVSVRSFTYVNADFYEYWKQFPFIRSGHGYACLVNNKYVYDKIIGFGRNLKYSYKLHHLVRGHTNFGEYVVDHINGCKLDNRFKNLRTATIQQNAQNGRKLGTREVSSVYKGVCFVPARVGYSKKRKDKPWKAYITWDNGKRSIQRYYETEIEAALKYNEFATEIFGEFAKLNVIKAP